MHRTSKFTATMADAALCRKSKNNSQLTGSTNLY